MTEAATHVITDRDPGDENDASEPVEAIAQALQELAELGGRFGIEVDQRPTETRLRMRLGLPPIAEARSCSPMIYDRRCVVGTVQ